jgi:hypothetical protein
MTASGRAAGRLSATLRLKRETLRAGQILTRLLGRETTVYVDQRVAEYRSYWSGAAARLSASFRDIMPGVWEVSLGDRTTRIANYVTEADDPVTLHLAGDKPYCNERAEELGIPLASLGTFALLDLDAIVSLAARTEVPLVVKPASGSSSGLGITTQIRSQRELERAVLLASLYSENLLVERFVPRESCRLLFLNGELLHAVRRRGVRVIGDGRSDIATLMRNAGYAHLTGDPSCALTLRAQRLDLATVPDRDSETVVRHLPAG